MSEELSPFLPWAADETRLQKFVDEVISTQGQFAKGFFIQELLRHIAMIEERLDNE